MSRAVDLKKKYPSIPWDVIVRWDAKVHGVRDTGLLDEYYAWQRKIGVGTYANYDFDITLEDWVNAKPGRKKDGQILRPISFMLKSGFSIQSDRVNSKSDVEIREESKGKFALYQGDERVEEVFIREEVMPAKGPQFDSGVTSKGIPFSDLMHPMTKNCFFIVPVRFCQYFPMGLACKFCNFNGTQEQLAGVGVNRSTTINVADALDAYQAFAAQTHVVEGHLEFGGFAKSEDEAKIHYQFIEKMKAATPYNANFTIYSQPMSRKDMQRLKDTGLECVGHQMEVWDRDLFHEIVPGKAKYTGHERYLEAFQEAVDIFGAGNVANVFVGGVTMIPENGHKTWQEARDSMIEGVNWMIKHGVLPVITNLRLPIGSVYGNDENRKKFPPTDYYLDIFLAHHDACKEYGLYDKLNKLMYCPLDCFIGNYSGELGAFELNGGLGNWAATAVPRKANWLLDWEEAISKATAVSQ